MKKRDLFPVLLGYVSSLPPNTVLDIEVLHRLVVDEFGLKIKTSTLKQYLTFLANAGFSIIKKRVTRQKPIYFVIGEDHHWPFKLSLLEVKNLSVKKGSAAIGIVSSRKELGHPLILMYKKNEFDKPDSVVEVQDGDVFTEEYEIDFDQLTNEDVKEILVAAKIGDKEIGRILRQTLADTFSQVNEMIFALGNYERELTNIKRCKSDLENQKLALEGERSNLERQLVDAEQKITGCESNISVLESMKSDLSEKLLKEQDRSVELEKRISEQQNYIDNLEKKLKIKKEPTDKSQKFATIGDIMQSQQSKGG